MIRDLRVGALSLMRVGTFLPTRDLRVGTCMVIDESRGMVIYESGDIVLDESGYIVVDESGDIVVDESGDIVVDEWGHCRR